MHLLFLSSHCGTKTKIRYQLKLIRVRLESHVTLRIKGEAGDVMLYVANPTYYVQTV